MDVDSYHNACFVDVFTLFLEYLQLFLKSRIRYFKDQFAERLFPIDCKKDDWKKNVLKSTWNISFFIIRKIGTTLKSVANIDY